MLRITVITQSELTVLKVEGKLAGPWVAELERCWQMVISGTHQERLLIDLTEVAFVDSAGKELIRKICGQGADVAVTGPLMTSIVNELRHKSGSEDGPVVEEAS